MSWRVCGEPAKWALAAIRPRFAAFHRGDAEYDAHMSYLAACRQREEEMPYNNIVAYNENAAVLHYQHLASGPHPRRCAPF